MHAKNKFSIDCSATVQMQIDSAFVDMKKAARFIFSANV